MVDLCHQHFIARTQSIAPEGGLILTKVTVRGIRFFYIGTFEAVSTVPGPSAVVGVTSLRLEDAFIYDSEGFAEGLAALLNQHGIGGEPWQVATVSDFIDVPVIG